MRDFEESTEPVASSVIEKNPYHDVAAVEPCYYFQCLFTADSEIIGYGELDGYYRKEIEVSDGELYLPAGATSTCDRFVVTGGSSPLIEQFVNAIKSGNTLNKMEDGNLVINLDLDDANIDPSSLAGHIMASTPNNPISLGVLQPYLEGKDAGPCTSLVRVLNENPTLSVKS